MKSVKIIWSTALRVMSDPAPVVCRVSELPSMVIASPPSPSVITPLASKVPLAVRVPVAVKALLTVVVPVPAPIERVVAAPAKLTVVAVVLTSEKVVEPVVIEVVMSGEVPNTATPVPVSSDNELRRAAEVAVVVRFEDASVKTAREAVRPEKVIVPEDVMPVAPVIAPAAMSMVDESSVKASPPSPSVIIPLASSISFAVNVPATVIVDEAVVASERVMALDPESITMFPVEVPPNVRVFIRRDWMVPVAPVKDNPAPVVVAEIDAVGVPSFMPVIANSAEDVACPPTKKSTVELLGNKAPEP